MKSQILPRAAAAALIGFITLAAPAASCAFESA